MIPLKEAIEDFQGKIFLRSKIEGRRRREQQRMRQLDDITNSMDMNLEQAPGDSEGQRTWCAM